MKTIPPEVYDACRSLARDALFVVCNGVIQREARAINVQVESFEPAEIDDALENVRARDFH